MFREVAERLRAPGRQVVPSRKALGIEIREPLSGIHLSYLYASPSIEEWDSRVQGRALVLNAWVLRTGRRRKLRKVHGYLRGSEPHIVVDHDDRQATWKPNPHAERVYMTSLPPVLGRSPAGAEGRILEFLERCFEHLQGKGYLVEQVRRP